LWSDANRPPNELDLEKIPGLTGIVRITSIDAHVCALNKSGSVLCWGRNQRGELGRGNTSDVSLTPAPVVLPTSAKSIGGAVNHSCAILVDDTVWCWGGNASRRPGNSNNTVRGQVGALADGGVDLFTATPRRIHGLPPGAVRAVAGGYEHSCALMASGAVYCWGSNSHGQLGRGKEDASADNLAHPTAMRVVF
jgi:alpha-tubulin suppressor-like RCC1 family protein